MSKKIHMGDRLKVRYDDACGPKGSKLERREILELAEKDLETEGSRIAINSKSRELIDIKVLPSLHAVMECALGVIDSEMRHMLRISQPKLRPNGCPRGTNDAGRDEIRNERC